MDVIETKLLSGTYGKEKRLRNLSFHVKRGECYGMIGKKDSGKTALLRILSGLCEPETGEYRLFGREMKEAMIELKSRMAYIPKVPVLDERLKVKDILDLSAGLCKKNTKNDQTALLKLFELEPGDHISDLAPMEVKCLAFINAFLLKPDLYLIDEPSSGLNFHFRERIFALLKEEIKRGASVLFTSSLISEIQELSNRCGILQEGKILMQGETEQMFPSNIRQVTLYGISSITPLAGMKRIRVSKNRSILQFLFMGDLRILFSELSRIPLRNVEIKDPNLDEVIGLYFEDGKE